MGHDAFISYSSKDHTTADAVRAHLEAAGIRCWIAPRDIMPGKDWSTAIVDAIAEARVMVMIYSSASNESKQVKREVQLAGDKGLAIVPLRIEDVPMSKSLQYFISSEQWLDALTRPLEDHLKQLAEAIAALLEPVGDGPSRSPSRGPAPARSKWRGRVTAILVTVILGLAAAVGRAFLDEVARRFTPAAIAPPTRRESPTQTSIAQSPVTQSPVIKSPVTQFPVTQSPITQSPVTQSPVTQSPVTQSPVTQSPVTQSPVTQSPVTQSPVTQLPVTQSPVTQSPVTTPPVTQSPVTQSPVTKPPVTQSPVSQSPVTRPPVTQSPVSQSPVTKPPVTQTGITQSPIIRPPAIPVPAVGVPLLDSVNPNPDFRLTVTTGEGKLDYAEGETISFKVTTDRDCYVTLISVDSAGSATLLLPNRWRPEADSLLRAGHPALIPADGALFTFPIQPPHGKTFVKAFGTLHPLQLQGITAEVIKQEGLVSRNAKGIGIAGVPVESNLNGRLDAHDWTTAELWVTTHALIGSKR